MQIELNDRFETFMIHIFPLLIPSGRLLEELGPRGKLSTVEWKKLLKGKISPPLLAPCLGKFEL